MRDEQLQLVLLVLVTSLNQLQLDELKPVDGTAPNDANWNGME